MSASWTTHKMAARHEEHLAHVFGGRVTRGSGNQWRDQTDGKTSPDAPYPLAWDGKATLGKSVSVTRAMWTKLTQQAGNYIPVLPLRFYRDERLTQVDLDLAVVRLDVLAELVSEANELARLRSEGMVG